MNVFESSEPGARHITENGAQGRSDGLETRRLALDILLRVEQGAYADVLLGHRLPGLSRSDRALVTSLVLGTITWKGRLDYELAHLLRGPTHRLGPEVLMLLRMGLYQLRFLNRMAPYAAVSTSVALARRTGPARWAAGLVNAVLRRATRETVPLPAPENDIVAHLAVAYSHPRWLVERFLKWFGRADAEAAMASNNAAAPTALRLNLRRGSREALLKRLENEGIKVQAGGVLPETAIVEGSLPLHSAAFGEGLFMLQSEASQLVAHLVQPPFAATVIDLTAAPGGKATHLAEMVGGQGKVIACDRNLRGLKALRALAARLGHGNVFTVAADVGAAAPFKPGDARYVLLDAPCTGLGTLRQHPEIRWRLKPDDPERMGKVQLEMLAKAAELTAPGGVLVYAVCSPAPEEGAEVVRAFLERHPGFRCEKPERWQARVGLRTVEAGDAGTLWCLWTRPGELGLDGYFAARLTNCKGGGNSGKGD